MNGLSLGIPGVGAVRPGTHFCALYSGPAERDRLLHPFLDEGLRQGDKCLCLIDDVEPTLVRDRALGQPGPEYSRRSASSARRVVDVGPITPSAFHIVPFTAAPRKGLHKLHRQDHHRRHLERCLATGTVI